MLLFFCNFDKLYYSDLVDMDMKYVLKYFYISKRVGETDAVGVCDLQIQRYVLRTLMKDQYQILERPVMIPSLNEPLNKADCFVG